MPETVYISEADAVRDFAGLVNRALKGQQIVVRRAGRDVVMLSPVVAGPEISTRTLGEVIEGLRAWEAEQGPLRMGADFADDVEEAHRRLNEPLDDSKWG